MLVAAALGGLTLAPACGALPPEHQILTDFFEASRARDTTILAGIAAVTFEPRTEGSVQQFEIVEFGAEQPAADGSTSKQVTVTARVRTPDGQVVPKSLVVTMQRAADARRWFITQLLVSRTSP